MLEEPPMEVWNPPFPTKSY